MTSVPHPSRLPLAFLGALLILPGPCSMIATLPVVGFGFQAFRGETLAGGFFLIGSFLVPLGFAAACWGVWTLARSRGRASGTPPGFLPVAIGCLLILPGLGLLVFLTSGVLPRMSGNDRDIARLLMVVTPLLAACGVGMARW